MMRIGRVKGPVQSERVPLEVSSSQLRHDRLEGPSYFDDGRSQGLYLNRDWAPRVSAAWETVGYYQTAVARGRWPLQVWPSSLPHGSQSETFSFVRSSMLRYLRGCSRIRWFPG